MKMAVSQQDRTDPLAPVADLVMQHCGMKLLPSRRHHLVSALRKLFGKVEIPDGEAVRKRLAEDPPLYKELLEHLLIPETYFFRDPQQFAFIRDEAIPRRRAERTSGTPLRLLSAGCSTGEEAYSLAIIAGLDTRNGPFEIIGADINTAALEQARTAVYGTRSFRGEGAEMTRPFLRSAGHNRFRLEDRITGKVGFRRLNLLNPGIAEPGGVPGNQDVVLCRNVLIYFTPEAIARAARLLYDLLAPGGYLITGASDPPLREFVPLETELSKSGIIYRRPYKPLTRTFGGRPAPVRVVQRTADETPRRNGKTAPSAKPPLSASRTSGRAQGSRQVDEARIAHSVHDGHGKQEDITPLDALFHHAMSLLEKGQTEQSERFFRKLLYMDQSLAVAHFARGTALLRLGRRKEAARSFRNALELTEREAEDRPLALIREETAGELAKAAQRQLTGLLEGKGAGE
ncbi:CheR family methyltransferase [Limibacillus sp. MBR-115]|jgi:chemotaxis protein methyltransferase CheR|uniref:CheR family methyltransferase n=1 Tax=Limibacillus sp. MBR-115 TaxID=3156465 RepID=UPI003391391F